MSEGALFAATAIFLFAFFLGTDIFRRSRSESGRLKSFIREDNPAAAMLRCRAIVELDGGRTIEASVPGCVLCLGRLREGDRILVVKCAEGYQAELPYLPGKSAACAVPRGRRD